MRILLILLLLLFSCGRKENLTLSPSIYNENIQILFLSREEMQEIDTSINFDAIDAITYCQGGIITIWFSSENPPKDVVNHEFFHATVCIMEWVGIPLSEDTNEAYAYLFGYLTKEFYEKR